jgi:hypothetical protein
MLIAAVGCIKEDIKLNPAAEDANALSVDLRSKVGLQTRRS